METVVIALWGALTVFVTVVYWGRVILGRRERAWQERLRQQAEESYSEAGYTPPPL